MKVHFGFRLLAIALLLCGLAACLASPFQSRAERERLTVRWVGKALARMGEQRLADRFLKDYFENKRVHFAPMDGREENANTGANKKGINEVTFSDAMLGVGDQHKLLQQDMFRGSTQVLLWAITVAHEYQHMDQKNPQNLPPWEDPAWRATDRMVADWTKRLQSEYEQLVKQPGTKGRDAKIDPIKAIIQRLKSEIGNLSEGADLNIKTKKMSPDVKLTLDESLARMNSVLAAMDKRKAVGALAPPKPKDKKGGWWEQISAEPFDKVAATDNYMLTASDGSFTAKWWMGDDRFSFKATWTSPPKRILPTDKIKIDASVTMIENVGDYYSANGAFAVWVDRPDCEPGFVISPYMGIANLNISHKASIPVPPPTSGVLDGSKLPTGTKGAKVAFMVFVGNGRNGGYRYIYEWKDGW